MPTPKNNIVITPLSESLVTPVTGANLSSLKPSTTPALGEPIMVTADPSKYDIGFVPSVTMDNSNALDEYHAQQQSIGNRIASGIGRLGLTAATKLGTSVGYLGASLYEAAATPLSGGGFNDYISNVVQNPWSQIFDTAEKAVKNDLLPIYKTRLYNNGNIWDQMQTASFWTDDLVDGLAFAASAYGPGLAMSGLGLGTKIASGLFGVGKVVVGAEEVAGAVAGTYAASKPFAAFAEALGTTGRMAGKLITPGGIAPAIDRFATTAIAVQSEAMFEAKDARDQTIAYWKTQRDPSTGLYWTGNEDFVKERAGQAAAGVYKGNVAALALSNWIEAGSLLKPFGQTKRALGEVIEKGTLAKTMFKELGKNAIMEGPYEENIQAAIQSVYGNAAKSKDGISPALLDSWGKIGSNMVDNFTTDDGLKQIVMGSLIGVLMGSVGAYGEHKQEVQHKTFIDKAIHDAAINYNLRTTDLYQRDPVTKEIMRDEDGNELFDKAKAEQLGVNLAGNIISNTHDEIVGAKHGDHGLIDRIKNTRLASLFLSKFGFTDSNKIVGEDIDDILAKEKELGTADEYVNGRKVTLEEKANTLKQNAKMYNDIYERIVNDNLFVLDPHFANDKTGQLKENVKLAMYTYLVDNYNRSIDNNVITARIAELENKSSLQAPTATYTAKINEELTWLKSRKENNDKTIAENADSFEKWNNPITIRDASETFNKKYDTQIKEQKDAVDDKKAAAFKQSLKDRNVRHDDPKGLEIATKEAKKIKNGDTILANHLVDINAQDQTTDATNTQTVKTETKKSTDNDIAIQIVNDALGIPVEYRHVDELDEYKTNPIVKLIDDNVDAAIEQVSTMPDNNLKQYLINKILEKLGHSIETPIVTETKTKTKDNELNTHQKGIIDRIQSILNDVPEPLIKGLQAYKTVPIQYSDNTSIILNDNTKTDNSVLTMTDNNIVKTMEPIIANLTNVVTDIIDSNKSEIDTKIKEVFTQLHKRNDWRNADKIAINLFLDDLGYNEDVVDTNNDTVENSNPNNLNPNEDEQSQETNAQTGSETEGKGLLNQGDEDSDTSQEDESSSTSTDVSDEVWNKFVDTGKVENDILDTIVNKIIEGIVPSDKELAIREAYSKYIEDALNKANTSANDETETPSDEITIPLENLAGAVYLHYFHPKNSPFDITYDKNDNTVYPDELVDLYKQLYNLKVGDTAQVVVNVSPGDKTHRGEDFTIDNLPIDMQINGKSMFMFNDPSHLRDEIDITNRIIAAAERNDINLLKTTRNALSGKLTQSEMVDHIMALMGSDFVIKQPSMITILSKNILNKLTYGDKTGKSKSVQDYLSHLNNYKNRIDADLAMTTPVRNIVWKAFENGKTTGLNVKIESILGGDFHTGKNEVSIDKVFNTNLKDALIARPNKLRTGFVNAANTNTIDGIEDKTPRPGTPIYYVSYETLSKKPMLVPLKSRKLNEKDINETYNLLSDVLDHLKTVNNTIDKDGLTNTQDIKTKLDRLKDLLNVTLLLTKDTNDNVITKYDMFLRSHLTTDTNAPGGTSIGNIKIDGETYSIFITDNFGNKDNADIKPVGKGQFTFTKKNTDGSYTTIKTEKQIKDALAKLTRNINYSSFKDNPAYKEEILSTVLTTNVTMIVNKNGNKVGVAQPFGRETTYNAIVNVSPIRNTPIIEKPFIEQIQIRDTTPNDVLPIEDPNIVITQTDSNSNIAIDSSVSNTSSSLGDALSGMSIEARSFAEYDPTKLYTEGKYPTSTPDEIANNWTEMFGGTESLRIDSKPFIWHSEKYHGMFYTAVGTIADTRIGSDAERFTEYHEAFHRVMELFLTDERKKRVLADARLEYPNLTDSQLNEKLAEQFRLYRITKLREETKNDVTVFGMKLPESVRDFFDKILLYINTMLGRREEIKLLFQDIEQGKFQDSNLTFTNRIDTLNTNLIPNFTNVTQEEAIGSTLGLIETAYSNLLNYTPTQFIKEVGGIRNMLINSFNSAINKQQDHIDNYQGIINVLETVSDITNTSLKDDRLLLTDAERMLDGLKTIKDDLASNTSNLSIFKLALNRFEELNYIKLTEIDEDYVTSVDMEQRNTRSFDHEESQNSKSAEREYSPITRILIHKLQDMTFDSFSGKSTPMFYRSTGLKQYVNFYKYKNKLHEISANAISSKDVLSRIKEYASVLPVMNELYSILTDTSSPAAITISQRYLNAFYADFNRSTTPYISTRIEQGDKIATKLVTLNKEPYMVLTDKWAESIKSFIWDGTIETRFGKFIPANTYENIEEHDPSNDNSLVGNKAFSDVRDMFNNPTSNYKTQVNQLVDIAKLLGIDVDANDINIFVRTKSDNTDKSIHTVMVELRDTLDAVRSKAIGLKTGKQEFDNYGDLNELTAIISKHRLDSNENSYYDISNKQAFRYDLNNTVSNMNNKIRARATDLDAVAQRAQLFTDLMTDPSYKFSNWFSPIGQLELMKDGIANSTSTNKFQLMLEGGMNNISYNQNVKFNKMKPDEWTYSMLSKYVNNFKGESRNTVRLALSVLSDSTKSLYVTVNKISILTSHIESFDIDNFAINHSSPMYTALWNMIRQEEARMKQARELLFKFTKGKFVPKSSKEIAKLNLLENYHYKKVDKNGVPIIFENGKATGNVFTFKDFKGLNDLNLRTEEGILRPIIVKGVSVDSLEIGSNVTAINNVIDTWISNTVKVNYTKMNSVLSDPNTSLFEDAKHINTDLNLRSIHTIAEFALNRKIALVEGQNLLFGKTAEFSNEMQTNKRAKGVISNGTQSFDNGIITMQTISDIIMPSRVMENYYNSVAANLIKDRGYSIATDELEHELDTAVDKIIGVEGKSAYGKINTGDGQGYSTPTRIVAILKSRSIFDTFANQFEYRKNSNGTDYVNSIGQKRYKFKDGLTVKDISTVARVVKGFIYQRTLDENLSMMKNDMVKYSSIPLVSDLIKGSSLEKLLDYMDEVGTDELVFESAKKSGNYAPSTIHNENGTLKENFADILNAHPTEQINASSWVNQLDISDHSMDHENKLGIQPAVHIYSNMQDDTDYTLETGDVIKGKDLRDEGLRLVGDNVKEDGQKMIDEFKLDSTDPAERNQAITNVLLKQMTLANNDEKTGVTINPITKERYRPIDSSSFMYKAESIITAMFTNNVINQKFPGGHLVLASDAFLDRPKWMGEQEATEKGFISSDDTPLGVTFDKDNNILYFDAYMAAFSQDMFDANGELIFDTNNVPDFLKEVIAYRIPNSGKHSMAILRVRKFLPRSAGPTIIVSNDIIQRMGSDFDVDSLFLMTPTFKTREVLTEDSIGSRTEFYIPTQEDVDNGKATSRDLRNNRLLTIWKSILRNSSHAAEGINGATYTSTEEMRDTIYKEMGVDNSSIDVTSSEGQDLFRDRANLGKDMIPITAMFGAGLAKLQALKAQLQPGDAIKVPYTFKELGITSDNIGSKLSDLKDKYGEVEVTKGIITIAHRNFGWNYDDSFTDIQSNLITSEVGELLDNSADNVKSELPPNFNGITANTILGLTSLGIPRLMAFRLVNQESVINYVKAQSEGTINNPKNSKFALNAVLDGLYVNVFNAKIANDKYVQGFQYSPDTTDVSITGMIKDNKRILITDDNQTAILNHLGLSSTAIPSTNELLQRGLTYATSMKDGSNDVSTELAYWKQQVNALLWYNEMNKKLAIVNKTMIALNTDKLSVGPTIQISRDITDKILESTYREGNEFVKPQDGLVYDNNKSLLDAVYPTLFNVSNDPLYSVLQDYYDNAYGKVITVFRNVFISESENYRELITMFRNSLNFMDNATIDTLEKHMNYYVNSLIYSRNETLDMTAEEQQELLGVTGDNSFAKHVIDAKKKLDVQPGQAHILNFIRFATDDIARTRNGYIKTITINTNNEGFTEDGIHDSIKLMYFRPTEISNDYTTKDLVTDMIKVSFLESKLAYGRNSMAKMIPHEVMNDLNIYRTWEDQKQSVVTGLLGSDNILHYINNFISAQMNNSNIAPIVITKWDWIKVDGKNVKNEDDYGNAITKNNTPNWTYSYDNDYMTNKIDIKASSLYKELPSVRNASFIRIRVPKGELKEGMNKYRTFYKAKEYMTGSGKYASKHLVYLEFNPMSTVDLPGNSRSIINSNNMTNWNLSEIQELIREEIDHNKAYDELKVEQNMLRNEAMDMINPDENEDSTLNDKCKRK